MDSPRLPLGARCGCAVVLEQMTFIIEAIKNDRHTVDIRSTAIVAVILARKLAADGFTVSIRDPAGDSYSSERFNLLLTSGRLDSQEIADDG
jgi:hypothetical protein